MFTGIIQAVGRIQSMTQKGGDVRVVIETGDLDLGDVELGDSIAVSGVCLTAVELPGHGFAADVSLETLSRTLFKNLKPGSAVNLEKALTPTTRLGGHLVSGHVDGLGEIISRREEARSIRFEIKAPNHLARYFAEKGSVCVDGISLTVNQVKGAVFDLNIVPHTAEKTTIDDWVVGAEVNLEVDVIARYLERLLLGDKAADENATLVDVAKAKSMGAGITEAFLAENGFK